MMSMLAVGVFQDAPPLEVAIAVVIAAIFAWALWIGARSGKNPPRDPDQAGEGGSPPA